MTIGKTILLFVVAVAILGGLWAFTVLDLPLDFFNDGVQDKTTTISVSGNILTVEIVDTPASRKKGLGGRDVLSRNSGMLFVFDESAPHGIWMQDMRFSIDIIWLDSDKRVVYVEPDVSPETYPAIFVPPEPALYVLELSSGRASEIGINRGTLLRFNLP